MLMVVISGTMLNDIGKAASSFAIHSPSRANLHIGTKINSELQNYYKSTKYAY
jgi:hypothetical protein